MIAWEMNYSVFEVWAIASGCQALEDDRHIFIYIYIYMCQAYHPGCPVLRLPIWMRALQQRKAVTDPGWLGAFPLV